MPEPTYTPAATFTIGDIEYTVTAGELQLADDRELIGSIPATYINVVGRTSDGTVVANTGWNPLVRETTTEPATDDDGDTHTATETRGFVGP